jgi:predicted nucleic acid-binding protein
MTVLADTSALFAVLDADDANHGRAKRKWIELIGSEAAFICTNYILVESFALIQRRLGWKALKAFHESILPMIQVEWIDEKIHLAASTVFFQSFKRSVSLVDCTSFVVMRKLGIDTAFAFDAHFKQEGFVCLG